MRIFLAGALGTEENNAQLKSVATERLLSYYYMSPSLTKLYLTKEGRTNGRKKKRPARRS